MIKRNKKLISAILGVLALALVSSIDSYSVSAASNRLWGKDRYETSAAISKQGWTNSDYVVLASGEGYADALCAAPLAKKYNAPIILTEASNLTEAAKAEIKRLNPKQVFIIGKYASVSQKAEDDLKALVSNIKRLGGNDRYETSVMVAKELGTAENLVLTSGLGFADALSIAPIAAQQNMPILLTGKDDLPQTVKEYIDSNKTSIKGTYVVGGEGVISNKAVNTASASAIRINGKDRFETNLKVMEYFKDKVKFDNLYVVQADGPTGKEFADALSGSALAAKTNSPIVLTYNTITDGVKDFIKQNSSKDTKIIPLGGMAAVPDPLIETIASSINNSVVTPVTPVPSTGGSSGGSGSSNDTNSQLSSIVSKLQSVKSSLNTDAEKAIVAQIITTVNSVIKDSSYDYKSDAEEVEELYDALSKDEQEDLQNKILNDSGLTLSELLKLKNQFGL